MTSHVQSIAEETCTTGDSEAYIMAHTFGAEGARALFFLSIPAFWFLDGLKEGGGVKTVMYPPPPLGPVGQI